ncbi:MAG: hypothetical protein JF617_05395 [Burkholderiales bacterium]|nr:hypothetical protein [Burkholderiales bacterium]
MRLTVTQAVLSWYCISAIGPPWKPVPSNSRPGAANGLSTAPLRAVMQPSVRTKDSMVGAALCTTLATAGVGGLVTMASRMRSTCSSVIGASPLGDTTGGGAGGGGGAYEGSNGAR